MSIKIKRATLPNTANGATSGETTFTTFDDPLRRHVIGVLMTQQTKGAIVQVMRVGKPMVELEGGVMAQQRQFIPVDIWYDSQIPMSFNVINNSGAGFGATESLLVMYDDGQGSSAGNPALG